MNHSTKHVIIGTAGHVDHGKTTLIRALTKIETDRLKEEKERGISIDIGFAYFDLPSGRRAGVIDVPGHERFIKNMLAGIGGIDLVVLVVAADEGVMPQTEEHLNIVSLLQVKKGLVALTKKDMVDPEWLELIGEQVRERLADTFLADAPIIPVSSVTGEGLDRLIAEIDRLTEEVSAKDTHAPVRLPIDRVFTVSGFGTVVTGTLTSGTLKLGDKVELMPSRIDTRVRSIQVHGHKEESASAGQRVAVNLAGVDLDQVTRGDVLAAPGRLTPSLMLDARLQLLKDAPRALANRTRIRLYMGTSEVLGRVVLLDKEELLPGESALVQFRLEEPVAAAKHDLYILRSYSPMVTIGGGTVIDPNPVKRGRFKEHVLEELRLKEQGSPLELVQQALYKVSPGFPTREDFVKNTHMASVDENLEQLVEAEQAVVIRADQKEYILDARWLQELRDQAEAILNRFHQANPLRTGLAKEELRSRVLKSVNSKLFAHLLLLWEAEGVIRQSGANLALANFEVRLNSEQQKIKEQLVKNFFDTAYNTPLPEEALQLFRERRDQALRIYELLLEDGTLVKLNEEVVLHSARLSEAEERLRSFFDQHQSLSLAEFRDLLGTSRKYALPILELFDQKKITIRQGEKRTLRSK
ncbi:MAG: selenocysteine-specific translation elongation factor [Bacillota bacterium]